VTSPYLYRVRDRTGKDHGVLEHPAPNVARGDVVTLSDGRKALVTALIGAGRGSRFAAVLEVIIEPASSDP
jgi:hypothetical protein